MGIRRHGRARRALPWAQPWRVFLSHTAELREATMERSFVAAAEAAVIRAGHAVTEMAYFAARDHEPADYCEKMVAEANVYVGIIGLRYGSPVRDRPDRSYTETEYDAATACGLPRLVFMIREDSVLLPTAGQPAEYAARQHAFRRRLLEDAGVTVAWVATPADLEISVYQALVELRHPSPRPRYPNRLRHLRGRRFTQEEMAERAGVSLSTYRNWEDGSHRPRPRAVRSLCEVLDVEEHELGFDLPRESGVFSGSAERPALADGEESVSMEPQGSTAMRPEEAAINDMIDWLAHAARLSPADVYRRVAARVGRPTAIGRHRPGKRSQLASALIDYYGRSALRDVGFSPYRVRVGENALDLSIAVREGWTGCAVELVNPISPGKRQCRCFRPIQAHRMISGRRACTVAAGPV
jgi:transcriptional regulator with XRE-family HTH domain